MFDDNVITHYQQFLDRRREQRPEDEYRIINAEEWQEFRNTSTNAGRTRLLRSPLRHRLHPRARTVD
ncbi:hypothetical protein AB0H34_09210 [Saccharopolyspora shandongensis]|uniref:hypothetical protein n=1 Tax=Saccharopolyspora shandongensis TaxID=418495 RepID=UPI00340EF940